MTLRSHEKFEKFVVWKMTRIWWIFIRAIQSLKITEELYVMTLKNDENLKRNWLTFQNWHKEFDEFWLEHWKVSKVCTLMGCFWPKYIMLELKKYRGVTFHDTGEWCQIWRITELFFQKWHGESCKFSPELFKIWKLEFSGDPFIQSRKCMSLKFTLEICVMTM